MQINDLIPEAIRSFIMRIRRPILGFTGPLENWSDGFREGYGYNNPKLSPSASECNPLSEPIGPKISDRQSRLGLALASVFLELQGKSEINVVDFGGARGEHYLLAKSVNKKQPLTWTIVEISNQVKAFETYSTQEVKWTTDLSDEQRELSIASGALQYAENAQEIWENFQKNSKFIILDRLSLNPGATHLMMKQNYWSKPTGRVSYPCWYFSRTKLLEDLSRTHDLIYSWDVAEDRPWVFGQRRSNSGFLFMVRSSAGKLSS